MFILKIILQLILNIILIATKWFEEDTNIWQYIYIVPYLALVS